MGPEDEINTGAAAPEPPPAPHTVHHMSVSEIEPLRALPEEEGPPRHEEPEFEPGPSFGAGM